MTILGLVLIALPVAIGVYAYVFYPLLLRLVAAWQPPDGPAPSGGELPLVSVVVPAYNEEAQIAGALEALLAQDYPADRRQIVVVSDCSRDGTDGIVRGYADRGVELLRLPQRSGKTAAENAVLPLLRGDIIVNTDASIRMAPGVLRALVSAMADARVGVASTRDVSIAARGAATASANATEAGYVGYEMRVRALETRTGGIVGASGSGYAIRAALHRIPVRPDLSRDFSAALTARRHGYRAVSVDAAIAYVPRTGSLRAEYRRKVRTIARGMETLIHNRALLDPTQHGAFAWKLASHKIARWLLPPAAVCGAIGLALLLPTWRWAALPLALAVLGLAAAAAGARWPAGRPMPRAVALVAFATASNVAVLHAMWRVLAGHDDALWEPTRRPVASLGSG